MKYDELGTRTRTLGCKGEQLLTIVIWRRELYVQQRTRTPVIPVRDWFGRHTCESVRLLVRLSLTVVRFTVSEDQNVPGRSPYRPAAVWRLKGQKSRTPKCRNHFSTHAPTHPSIHPPIHVFISKNDRNFCIWPDSRWEGLNTKMSKVPGRVCQLCQIFLYGITLYFSV